MTTFPLYPSRAAGCRHHYCCSTVLQFQQVIHYLVNEGVERNVTMETQLAEEFNCSNADKRLSCCIVLKQQIARETRTECLRVCVHPCADSPHLGQPAQQAEHLSLVRDIGEIEPLE